MSMAGRFRRWLDGRSELANARYYQSLLATEDHCTEAIAATWTMFQRQQNSALSLVDKIDLFSKSAFFGIRRNFKLLAKSRDFELWPIVLRGIRQSQVHSDDELRNVVVVLKNRYGLIDLKWTDLRRNTEKSDSEVRKQINEFRTDVDHAWRKFFMNIAWNSMPLGAKISMFALKISDQIPQKYPLLAESSEDMRIKVIVDVIASTGFHSEKELDAAIAQIEYMSTNPPPA